MANEIVGREETEEAEIAGEEYGEEIGASFSTIRERLRSRLGKKAIKPIKKVAATVAPRTVFSFLKAARKKPGLAKKIAAIKKIAVTPSEELPTEAQIMQPVAMEAWKNLQAASDVQDQSYEDTGDYYSYDPYEESWMEEYNYDDYESVEGGPSLYEWGAMAGMNDVLGFSLKKLVRKVGRAIDPTRAGSPFRSAVSAIPGIGPQLTSAADMVAKARAGIPSAKTKIEDVKKLAASGDPKGKEALANLQAANKLAPSRKLLGFFDTYEYGARVQV